MATDLTALVSQLSALCTQLQASLQPTDDSGPASGDAFGDSSTLPDDAVTKALTDFTVGWTKEDALALIKLICETECKGFGTAEASGEMTVRIVQHLHRTFDLTADDFRANDNHFMHWAASRSHVALFQYFKEVVGLTAEDARAHNLVCVASLDVLKYLKSGFGLTKEDAMKGNNYALYLAVQSADLDRVKALKEVYGLTGDDVKDIANTLIERCTWHNPNLKSLEVLKYLKEELNVKDPMHLRLTINCPPAMLQYLKAEFGTILHNLPLNYTSQAAARGNLELLKCLKEDFGATAEELAWNDWEGVYEAASHGHVEVLKYLHTDFGLSREAAVAHENRALFGSARRGHLEVVKCLREDYGLTAADFRAYNSEALVEAAKDGHTAVVDYMWGVMHGEAVRTENGEGGAHGGAATAVNPPNLNSLMELLNTVKNPMVDMSQYDSALKDFAVTAIFTYTGCVINIAGTRLQLEQGTSLNIGKERARNPAFDIICRATSPSGSNPDECIVISRALWKCTPGAEIQLWCGPHRFFIVKAAGYTSAIA